MQYFTAGESHGSALTAIVTGVPAGLTLTEEAINADLARRRSGFGRSVRQRLEGDEVLITGGVHFGRTTGAPVSLMIRNAVAEEHAADMAPAGNPPAGYERSFVPRPGHADLAGVQKYGFGDCRDVAERASARETAARVAAAGIAWEFLAELDVDLFSLVCGIGGVEMSLDVNDMLSFSKLDIETSELRCPDAAVTAAMAERIRAAAEAGTSVGGTFCVVASGLVPGLGGYASGSERLTSRLGAAVLSVPSVKGVEFGLGFEAARRDGRDALDEILLSPAGFSRATNFAGGLEGGMTTGEPLILRAAVKPIPTQAAPLVSVNLDTLEPAPAPAPRADVCAVPAAAVVAEAEVAFVLAQAYLEKFGADAMADIKAAVRQYRQRLRLMTR
ncbi:MAG: chorismate synthase [Eggerthellaceae bacterium]|nr:chorismate synthase [Eggerthellaceae bacterium]